MSKWSNINALAGEIVLASDDTVTIEASNGGRVRLFVQVLPPPRTQLLIERFTLGSFESERGVCAVQPDQARSTLSICAVSLERVSELHRSTERIHDQWTACTHDICTCLLVECSQWSRLRVRNGAIKSVDPDHCHRTVPPSPPPNLVFDRFTIGSFER